MTWRRGEAGSTLIDRPKDAPVPDFTNGKERVMLDQEPRLLIFHFAGRGGYNSREATVQEQRLFNNL